MRMAKNIKKDALIKANFMENVQNFMKMVKNIMKVFLKMGNKYMEKELNILKMAKSNIAERFNKA